MSKYKIVICRHWKKGYCLRGEWCGFKHGTQDGPSRYHQHRSTELAQLLEEDDFVIVSHPEPEPTRPEKKRI